MTSCLRPSRRRLVAAALGLGAAALAGCGGGATVGAGSRATFQLFVTSGVFGYPPVLSGATTDVAAGLGQPVAFDASEPVVWRFAVSGSPLFDSGSVATVGGVTLVLSQFTPSRAVIESRAAGLALLPLFVLLTATSTFDGAQVATVRLRIG